MNDPADEQAWIGHVVVRFPVPVPHLRCAAATPEGMCRAPLAHPASVWPGDPAWTCFDEASESRLLHLRCTHHDHPDAPVEYGWQIVHVARPERFSGEYDPTVWARIAADPNAPADVLESLSEDPFARVRNALSRNPAVADHIRAVAALP